MLDKYSGHHEFSRIQDGAFIETVVVVFTYFMLVFCEIKGINSFSRGVEPEISYMALFEPDLRRLIEGNREIVVRI